MTARTFLQSLVPVFRAPCAYIALARLDRLPDPADASSSKRRLPGGAESQDD